MSAQTKYVNKLAGARLLVFGGSSGIGFAVAQAAVENGATVIISSSDASRLSSAVDSIKKSYPSASDRISGQVCNLAVASQAESNIEAIFQAAGKVDHVVYTAGDALAMAPIANITTESAHQAGQVRFFSPLMVAKYAANYLTPGPRSSLTFTSGIVGERPIPGWPLVSAYATALQGLVRALAVDLKPVRVNLVSPGVVDTGLYATSGIPDEVKNGIFAGAAAKLPLGRVAVPEDLAESYIYAMRSEAVTGEILNASGGNLVV